MSEKPEDDLSDLQEAHIVGSCEWFSEKIEFQTWMDSFAGDSPRVLWVSANPATGKSVLAGYIINYLESLNLDCSYYFFHYGNKAKSSLSSCLRSIAYQMAMSSVFARKRLLSMIENDICFDKEDERAVWRKVFTTNILRSNSQQFHYWVIDALDECVNAGAFFQTIAKLESTVPVKIFVTSRKVPEIADQFLDLQKKSEGRSVICEEISSMETQGDIRLYLQANMKKLRVGNDKNSRELSEKILMRSQGCFLWVRLVLEELAGAWSKQQIEQVLDELPQDMDLFYARALNLMSLNPSRTKQLTKCILVWTMCAARPLTIDELKEALKLDLGYEIDDLHNAVLSLCGQLVHIDKNKRVLMIHLTARTFLLTEELQSEFAINKRLSHLHLAEVCLQYLNSNEMRPPRVRRSSKVLHHRKRSTFLTYASVSFSEHIRQTSSHNETLIGCLETFLKGNVLSWIEHAAQRGDLNCLTWAAKVLKNYLQRQAQHRSAVGKEFQRVDAWATDLVRLTAKFGKNLLQHPSSIYWLIPPFCPSSSAIASQFGTSPRGIVVHGLSGSGWDDRLACIDFVNKQATALCCGDSYFAIGLSTGFIVLFHNATCQEWKTLWHREPLKHLTVDESGKLLGSSSRRTLKVWDIEKEQAVWHFDTSFDIILFFFGNDNKVLTAVTKENALQSWSLETGLATEHCPWEESFGEQQFRRPPLTAAVNPELSMLAIIYRGRPVSLWDIDDQALYGLLGRESDPSSLALGTNTSVSSLVFSSNESVPLLAAAYEDGDLALFNYWDLELIKVLEANAQVVASSSDGCTLVTGNSAGMIQLFEFETLQLLYRVNSFDYGVRSLAFSKDSLRFLDVRGKQCNVWEPSILFGLNQQEEDSSTEANPSEPRIIGISEDGKNADVTTLVAHDSGNYFFCGRSDGSVWSYEARNVKSRSMLYQHVNDIPITCSIWGPVIGVLVTADAAARFVARRLIQDSSTRCWTAGDVLLDAHSDFAIRQLLLNPANNRLLVSTSRSDVIWDLPNRLQLRTETYKSRSTFQWINHPLNCEELIMLSTIDVILCSWGNSGPSIPVCKLALDDCGFKIGIDEDIKRVIQLADGEYFAVEFAKLHGDRQTTQFLVFESKNCHAKVEEISPSGAFKSFARNIMHIIGAFERKIVFLDRNFWVCTIDVESSAGESYIRHFFIPSDWYSQQKQLIIQVSVQGDVLFVRGDEVAVVSNGLEHEELLHNPSEV